MGMNHTPSGNRIHIGFFGKRNAGKSSLVNAVTGQNLSIVSEIKGTTTDPVYKAMELLPLGPVMIIDTPGMDDEGDLGELRIEKTKQVLNKTDIAVLVVDATCGITSFEKALLAAFKEKEVSYVIAWNKEDLVLMKEQKENENEIWVSALTGKGVDLLKEMLPRLVSVSKERFQLVADLLQPMDVVVLVVPIDESAPKGRLILPQQQVIRDILEIGAIAVVVKNSEYKQTLEKLGQKPRLVITDSQVFKQIAKDTPEDVPLTSFSILMARKKGFLKVAVEGIHMLDSIQNGDRILIAEGCTHHRQCGDIGTVKLPQWIRAHTKREPEFAFCSGTEFPEDLSAYKLVLHCGGCMLNEREMCYRMKCAQNQNVPFTNYGIAIAQMNHILARSLYALQDKF